MKQIEVTDWSRAWDWAWAWAWYWDRAWDSAWARDWDWPRDHVEITEVCNEADRDY